MATRSSSSSPPILRRTSPSTGLSYLSNHSTTAKYQTIYVLIHGWACSATDYIPLLTSLTSSTSAYSLAQSTTALFIAPDLPGHSNTPASTLPHPTVASCARLINDLCHEFSPYTDDGIDRECVLETVIIGHSMGVRIALECFAQQPQLVTGVVLLDGSWYGRNPKDYKPACPSSAEELRVVREVFESMMGPETPKAFRQQVQERLAAVDFEYVGRLRADYIHWDGERMEEVLGMIGQGSTVGVLVVQGTEGHGRERRMLRAGDEGPWMQFVRKSVAWQGGTYTGVVVERSGHWVHVDRVAEVAEAVKRFGSGRARVGFGD